MGAEPRHQRETAAWASVRECPLSAALRSSRVRISVGRIRASVPERDVRSEMRSSRRRTGSRSSRYRPVLAGQPVQRQRRLLAAELPFERQPELLDDPARGRVRRMVDGDHAFDDRAARTRRRGWPGPPRWRSRSPTCSGPASSRARSRRARVFVSVKLMPPPVSARTIQRRPKPRSCQCAREPAKSCSACSRVKAPPGAHQRITAGSAVSERNSSSRDSSSGSRRSRSVSMTCTLARSLIYSRPHCRASPVEREAGSRKHSAAPRLDSSKYSEAGASTGLR